VIDAVCDIVYARFGQQRHGQQRLGWGWPNSVFTCSVFLQERSKAHSACPALASLVHGWVPKKRTLNVLLSSVHGIDGVLTSKVQK
jgi:hypothetical protein